MYTFAKISKVISNKRKLRYKTSKQSFSSSPMDVKFGSHGNQMKCPWLRAQSPKGERKENPQLVGIIQTHKLAGVHRYQHTGRFSRQGSPKRAGAQEFYSPTTHWRSAVHLQYTSALHHHNPSEKGPCPHFRSVTTSIVICPFPAVSPIISSPKFAQAIFYFLDSRKLGMC